MKGLIFKWLFNEIINNFNKMENIGDFEFMVKLFDIVVKIERYFDVIEEEVNFIDIGNY